MSKYRFMWVFNGATWQPPSGVFSSKTTARTWISSKRLTGLLTAYPLGISVYDWALAEGILTSEERVANPGTFTHASLEHEHFEDGRLSGVGATLAQRQSKSEVQPIQLTSVWLFNGENKPLISGVFVTKDQAEIWIASNHLTGSLTLYPVDISIYDWAIKEGKFAPKSREEKQPVFIQQFTFIGQARHQYRNGKALEIP